MAMARLFLEIKLSLIDFGDVISNMEDYFRERPSAAARRHRAGVDAEALRCAWLAVIAPDQRTEKQA